MISFSGVPIIFNCGWENMLPGTISEQFCEANEMWNTEILLSDRGGMNTKQRKNWWGYAQKEGVKKWSEIGMGAKEWKWKRRKCKSESSRRKKRVWWKRLDNVAAGAGEETAVKIFLNRAFIGATMRWELNISFLLQIVLSSERSKFIPQNMLHCADYLN